MAYTAWSVVFGEQPTAAKWNQLGTNDAGFKDGTNIDAGAIITSKLANDAVTAEKMIYGHVARRQGGSATNWATNGTTDYDVSGDDVLVQAGTKRSSSGGDVTVTFPVAYSQPPIVLFGQTLVNGSSFPRISGAGISTTGFAFSMVLANTAARSIDDCHWLAIGKP